jgi:hypothetical protein
MPYSCYLEYIVTVGVSPGNMGQHGSLGQVIFLMQKWQHTHGKMSGILLGCGFPALWEMWANMQVFPRVNA